MQNLSSSIKSTSNIAEQEIAIEDPQKEEQIYKTLSSKKIATVRPNLRALEALDKTIRPVTPFFDRLNKTNPSSVAFEIGINTQCTQLTKQYWNLYDEAQQFLNTINFIINSSDQILIQNQNTKYLNKFNFIKLFDENDSLEQLITNLTSIVNILVELHSQLNIFLQYQSQCKLVLLAKVYFSRRYCTQSVLVILHHVSKLIRKLICLIGILPIDESEQNENVCNVIRLCKTYQNSLDSFIISNNSNLQIEKYEEDQILISKLKYYKKTMEIILNDHSSSSLNLKNYSILKFFNLYIEERIFPASYHFIELIKQNFLVNSQIAITLNNPEELIKKFNNFEICLNEEEIRIKYILSISAFEEELIKEETINENRNLKFKIINHYRQLLWESIGRVSIDLLLWSIHLTKNKANLPLSFHSWTQISSFRNILEFGIQFSNQGNLGEMLTVFDLISSSLHSYILCIVWDEELRNCFQTISKIKRPEHLIIIDDLNESNIINSSSYDNFSTNIGMEISTLITKILIILLEDKVEKDAGEAIKIKQLTQKDHSQLELNTNSCVNNKIHVEIKTNEESLNDQIQILHYLEGLISFFNNWISKRCKSWLNNWKSIQFIALSQKDTKLIWKLFKSYQTILVTNNTILNNENISIRINGRLKEIVSLELKDALEHLNMIPNELIDDITPICHTFALATLQSIMPHPKYWQTSEFVQLPTNASNYVNILISKIIEPMISACVKFINCPIAQESVCRRVVGAVSEAWLDYILQKNIKFSEWGAVQLLKDFKSLRDWIESETLLIDDVRRGIIGLEVIKRCEGVGHLLLRSPGDVLGVGKSNTKTHSQISSTQSINSCDSTPSSHSPSSIREDDIPPEMYVPNQQIWLKLRLGKKPFSFCSFCT